MTDTIAEIPRTPGTDPTLRRALLDSRQRWRDLVITAADLAYETDAWGRFVSSCRTRHLVGLLRT